MWRRLVETISLCDNPTPVHCYRSVDTQHPSQYIFDIIITSLVSHVSYYSTGYSQIILNLVA
jgi:hypothetical protein